MKSQACCCSDMCEVFREEFSWKCLALRCPKREAFCEAQWRWPGLVFVLYRLVMAGYSIFAFTHMAVTLDDPHFPHNFMVYLTNWTYLVHTIFFCWGAALAVAFYFWPRYFQSRPDPNACGGYRGGPGDDVESQAKTSGGVDNPVFSGGRDGDIGKDTAGSGSGASARPPPPRPCPAVRSSGDVGVSDVTEDQDGRLPWYVQAYWVLANVIQVSSLVVTVIYFGALYEPSDGVSLVDLNVHGLSSVMIVVDVVLCARPVRLLHGIFPVVYGAAYVVFSAIYWSQDKENNVLYPDVLDWNHPGPTCAVVFGLALVGIPLLQLLHFGLYRLRLWVHLRLYGERYL